MTVDVQKYTLNFDFTATDGFKAVEIIDLMTRDENIFLDCKGMNIRSVKCKDEELKFNYDADKKKLGIQIPIIEGKNSIEINYESQFTKGITGIYQIQRKDIDMISTEFEPTGAPFAFPCFDEPSMKAVFSISMKVKDGYEGISNMPIESAQNVEGGKIITFKDTPKMSTYLVYIGVGKFTTRTIKHGDVHITLAVPGSELRSDDYPLEVAAKCLDFYSEYFGIPYDLPKLHLIAVPDSAAGAMENWGAITFREDALLHNENSDTSSRIYITTTIAHELAHQWFGNLVTMQWWNDLWLNESFATFMSSLCVNTIYPEYEEIKAYYLKKTVSSMKLDCLSSTHPIDVKVETPEEIEEIFDEISYGKGGSILRMIHKYVGDEKFKEGLRNYLNNFKYGNATGRELWNGIGNASGLPVDSILESWIGLEGFPVVKVKYDGTKLELEQEKFVLEEQKSDKIWKIPLFIWSESGLKTILMEEKKMEIQIEQLKGINVDGTGYYLTLYEEWEPERISNSTSLDEAYRANNGYFMFISGLKNFDWFSDLCVEMAENGESPATTLTVRNLQYMQAIVGKSAKFQRIANSVAKTLIERYEDSTKLKTMDVLTLKEANVLLAFNDQEYASEKARLFKNYFLVSPDDRELISVSKGLTSHEIDDMVEAYLIATDDTDKYNIMNGMTRASGKKNFKKILKMIEEAIVKPQDVPFAIFSLMKNEDARKFMISIFEDLIETVKNSIGETGILSTEVSVAIPYLGLENERKIKKKIADMDQKSIGMGVKKGNELLKVFKMIKSFAS